MTKNSSVIVNPLGTSRVFRVTAFSGAISGLASLLILTATVLDLCHSGRLFSALVLAFGGCAGIVTGSIAIWFQLNCLSMSLDANDLSPLVLLCGYVVWASAVFIICFALVLISVPIALWFACLVIYNRRRGIAFFETCESLILLVTNRNITNE